MSEYTPVGRKPKMTRAQVRKYQQEMEKKRLEAQKKLEEAKKNGDLDNSEEVLALEEKLDDLFS